MRDDSATRILAADITGIDDDSLVLQVCTAVPYVLKRLPGVCHRWRRLYLQGYLKMLSASASNAQWKKRYFVLQKAMLLFYKAPDSARPAGSIPVDDMVDVQQSDPGDASAPVNSFVLVGSCSSQLSPLTPLVTHAQAIAAPSAVGVSRRSSVHAVYPLICQ